jgi:peptide/nickel transport system substrate-binding protein
MRLAWADMMRGEVDFLYEVPQTALEFVQASSSIEVFSILRRYVYVLGFNSRHPGLRSPTVRRALNMAVDRTEVIAQALQGRGTAAFSPLWPQHWAFPREVPGYDHDPAAAAQILDGLGLLAGDAPHLPDADPSARFRFTCIFPERYGDLERLGLTIQKQLRQVGVDMRLEAVANDVFNTRGLNGDFDAVLIAILSGPSFSRAYPFWHSGHSLGNYHDAAADKCLDEIRQAPDQQSYRRATLGFQHRMLENPPGIFIAWSETARAVSRRFEVPAEPDRDIYGNMWQWRLAARSGRK